MAELTPIPKLETICIRVALWFLVLKALPRRLVCGRLRRRIIIPPLLALNGKLPYSQGMDALVEKVTGKIAEAIRPDKIILFGSRAKGTATGESDIDLVAGRSGPKAKREVELEIEGLFLYRF